MESFVEYIMASCAVVAYARMLYEATVTLLYITSLQDDNLASISSLSFYRPNAFLIFDQLCLQCFDTVGWAAACKKLTGGVLAWLSVWSEVQICIWPSLCHCHSLSLASVKSRSVLVPAHRGSPGQKDVKWVCVCVCKSS